MRMISLSVKVEQATLMRRKSPSKVVVEVGEKEAERVQWSRNGEGRGRGHGQIRERMRSV